jgi:hypothetical protein
MTVQVLYARLQCKYISAVMMLEYFKSSTKGNESGKECKFLSVFRFQIFVTIHL